MWNFVHIWIPTFLYSPPAPTQHDRISAELSTIKKIAATDISQSRSSGNDTSWYIWESFYWDLHINLYLSKIDDPIPLLQVFVHRYRKGTLAPGGAPVCSRMVEGALCAMGKTLSSLGYTDPRLQTPGKLNLHLRFQLSAYSKQDPPLVWVKPIPFLLIAQTAHMAYQANMAQTAALGVMLLLGFFFLLHLREYAYTANPDAQPFRLCDAHLLIQNLHIDPFTCSIDDYERINYITLEFTMQKNGVRGELVGLRKTGHPVWCPVHVSDYQQNTTKPMRL